MLDIHNSELTISGCILLVASAPARPPVFSNARHGPVAGDENGWCDLLAGRRCLTAACGLGGRATWPGNRSLIRVAARVRPGSSGYLSCAPGSSSTPSTPRSADTAPCCGGFHPTLSELHCPACVAPAPRHAPLAARGRARPPLCLLPHHPPPRPLHPPGLRSDKEYRRTGLQCSQYLI